MCKVAGREGRPDRISKGAEQARGKRSGPGHRLSKNTPGPPSFRPLAGGIRGRKPARYTRAGHLRSSVAALLRMRYARRSKGHREAAPAWLVRARRGRELPAYRGCSVTENLRTIVALRRLRSKRAAEQLDFSSAR